MSAEGILKIIRLHTGANASDTVKIPHAQVQAMIAAATEGGRTTGTERAWLISALKMFGGNMIHPDIFESKADKDALVATVMQGIETPETFALQPLRDQYEFLYKGVIIGGGDCIGFSQVTSDISGIADGVQTRVLKLEKSSFGRAGKDKYNSDAVPGITCITNPAGIYGYWVGFSFSSKAHKGYYDVEAILGPAGALLNHSEGFVPNDPPDPID